MKNDTNASTDCYVEGYETPVEAPLFNFDIMQ